MSLVRAYVRAGVALLTALVAIQSLSSDLRSATTSIGGVRIGSTSAALAHLGPPVVRRTGDALDPEWRFDGGLTVYFWDGGNVVAQVVSTGRSMCTDTGVCPEMPASQLNELLGPDVKGKYGTDGAHQYRAAYDECWLEVVVNDEKVESVALACQP